MASGHFPDVQVQRIAGLDRNLGDIMSETKTKYIIQRLVFGRWTEFCPADNEHDASRALAALRENQPRRGTFRSVKIVEDVTVLEDEWAAPQYPSGGWFAVGEERPL